jgi:uncharacterized membrane protein
LALTVLSPAKAHKEHKKQAAAAEKSEPSNGRSSSSSGAQQSDAPTMHETMGEMMSEPDRPASEMPWIERLLNWLGRIHPVIVHFPIAFFPAALFTAVVGRRRPAFAAPVQFLVVAGGMIAPVAALLGWFDGGFDLKNDDWMLQSHRWLGTGIGVGALGLGLWSWRRPDANRSFGMIIGLTLISTAIVIQGWFGGALVHGIDHMNW